VLTEYNSAGRAYRSIDNLGRIDETQYDDAGRVVRTIENYDDGGDGLVTESRAYYDSANYYATEYQYDERNRVTDVLTPADVVTHYEYDNLGRTLWTKTYASANFTLASTELRAQTRIYYDDLGRVYETHVYEVDQTTGDAGDHLTSEA